MASFISLLSSPPLLSRTTSPSLSHFKLLTRTRVLVLPVKCLSSGPPSSQDAESSEHETSSSSLSSSISTYKWCAGLGGVGFLESAYLSYLKLTNSDVFCPIGGGSSCGDVLNSDYAVIWGVPLPWIGMATYGLVATLALQLARKNLPIGMDESGRLLLLGSTTSLAAASAYFLYILSTKLSGASCAYCLMSALLSFSLFFITLKDFGLEEIQKVVGVQLCIASLVIATLSTSYSFSQPTSSSLAEVNLPYFETEVTTPSSSFAISLAKHLHAIGAKMYGAFWCSHCLEQKQMFGNEAVKMLDIVECFPNGYTKGIKIAKACSDAKIEGFPTWVINGQVFSGELELPGLAEASGFSELNQPS